MAKTKKNQYWFIRKETPKKSDYRFNYQKTPESALHYYVGYYCEVERRIGMSYSTRFVKTFKKMYTYNTRPEAEDAMNRLNEEYFQNWGKHLIP